MLIGGSSFGSNQVIHAIFFYNVRSFNPGRLFIDVGPAVNEYPLVSLYFETFGIKLLNPDRPVSIIERFVIGGNAVVYDIRFAIIIKKQ